MGQLASLTDAEGSTNGYRYGRDTGRKSKHVPRSCRWHRRRRHNTRITTFDYGPTSIGVRVKNRIKLATPFTFHYDTAGRLLLAGLPNACQLACWHDSATRIRSLMMRPSRMLMPPVARTATIIRISLMTRSVARLVNIFHHVRSNLNDHSRSTMRQSKGLQADLPGTPGKVHPHLHGPRGQLKKSSRGFGQRRRTRLRYFRTVTFERLRKRVSKVDPIMTTTLCSSIEFSHSGLRLKTTSLSHLRTPNHNKNLEDISGTIERYGFHSELRSRRPDHRLDRTTPC